MEMRDRLRSALSSGILASSDRLDECGDALGKVPGTDSLDLVELSMTVKEKGRKLDTVGDLMRFLDEIEDD
jgi:hypothetical protein